MAETQTFRFHDKLSRLSFVGLPYLNFVGFLGLFLVLVYLIRTFKRTALIAPIRRGLMAVSLLMILSSCFAANKGEAFVQLTHFLPFFLFFGFLPYLLKSAERLEQFAIDIVFATVPINVIAFFEYLLKSPYLPRKVLKWEWIDTIRSAPHKRRAMVMFDHPNALASYLVLILGLGLGLILLESLRQRSPQVAPSSWRSREWPSWLLYAAVYLNLVGIFCSGSRNGLLIAVSQLVASTLFVKNNRTIVLTGILSLFGILVGSALVGVGGRVVTVDKFTQDPRVGVWKIAFDLIRERPWWGWGLGNYKFQYPDRIIDPVYKEIFHPHNFWLLLASEAGIFVMVSFSAVIGYVCFRAVRLLLLKRIDPQQRALLLGYLFSFWGCVAFSLFDVTFYDARINVMGWVVLTGVYSLTELSLSDARAIASSSTF